MGRGRGGISENGEEEEGIGGGGNFGAGGIIPVGSIGGMADAIFLGGESVGGVLGREEREGEGEMSKPKPATLLKLVSEQNR